jgi:hypothetical protein
MEGVSDQNRGTAGGVFSLIDAHAAHFELAGGTGEDGMREDPERRYATGKPQTTSKNAMSHWRLLLAI